MADNILLNSGVGGSTLAADDISNVWYQRVKLVHGADGTNAGDVHVGNPLPIRVATDTAFGEVSSSELTPLFQGDFVYGINTRQFVTATTGSGSVSATGSLVSVDTTAATSSSATCYSNRNLRYRPGLGALARFTALFTTGAANSQQEAGPATANEGFLFGYNGTSFGICRRKGGADNWTAQSSWNVDVMDGTGASGMTLDPTKINVYQIRYQYLGAGAVEFFIENPATGRFVLVHRIEYANNNTTTHITDPSMPIRWHAVNTTNNTSIVVKGASAMLAIEGKRVPTGIPWSRSNYKASVTTETNIITFRAATTYNTLASRAIADVLSIGVATSSNTNGIGILRCRLNATLGGAPSYTAVSGSTADNGVTITSGQSTLSYDVAGTTVSGGTIIWATSLSNASSATIPVYDFPLHMEAGDTLTFSVESTTSTTAAVSVSLLEVL